MPQRFLCLGHHLTYLVAAYRAGIFSAADPAISKLEIYWGDAKTKYALLHAVSVPDKQLFMYELTSPPVSDDGALLIEQWAYGCELDKLDRPPDPLQTAATTSISPHLFPLLAEMVGPPERVGNEVIDQFNLNRPAGMNGFGSPALECAPERWLPDRIVFLPNLAMIKTDGSGGAIER